MAAKHWWAVDFMFFGVLVFSAAWPCFPGEVRGDMSGQRSRPGSGCRYLDFLEITASNRPLGGKANNLAALFDTFRQKMESEPPFGEAALPGAKQAGWPMACQAAVIP